MQGINPTKTQIPGTQQGTEAPKQEHQWIIIEMAASST